MYVVVKSDEKWPQFDLRTQCPLKDIFLFRRAVRQALDEFISLGASYSASREFQEFLDNESSVFGRTVWRPPERPS